jgi:hypothetical protein
MRGSAASLPGRPADCCRKIGSGARYTPVTGSRTQIKFSATARAGGGDPPIRIRRHPEERRHGHLIAALNRKDRYPYADFGKVLLESEFDVPTRILEGEPLPKERVRSGD